MIEGVPLPLWSGSRKTKRKKNHLCKINTITPRIQEYKRQAVFVFFRTKFFPEATRFRVLIGTRPQRVHVSVLVRFNSTNPELRARLNVPENKCGKICVTYACACVQHLYTWFWARVKKLMVKKYHGRRNFNRLQFLYPIDERDALNFIECKPVRHE